MSGKTTSALVGNPPNNQRDYYIVRGLNRSYGLDNADPNDGFTYFAAKPVGYVHETKTVQALVGVVIMMLTILIPTIARVMLRVFNPGMEFGSDDWAIIVAACVATLFSIVHMLVILQGGGGHHVWEVTYEEYNSFAYWGNAAATLHYVTVSLIKLSITLFLRRVAHQASLPWRIFCDIFLASLVLYIVYALLSTSIFCSPVKAGWNLEIRGQLEEPATCFDIYYNMRALSVTHLIQGVVLLSSPIIMLWKIHMSLSKKIRLFSFWVVGALAVLGALLDYLLQNISSDNTWSYTSVIIWVAIDVCSGMLTASLPVLDALIAAAWRSTRRKISTGRHSRGDLCAKSQSNHPDARSWQDQNSPMAAESVIGSSAHRSESQEHFAQEERIEMDTIRTLEVRYSTVRTPDSIDEMPSRS